MIPFGWQPMATAPRDGTAFVHLYVVIYAAGCVGRPDWRQPFAGPLARWPRESARQGRGYWSIVTDDERDYSSGLRPQCSVADTGATGWWTTFDAYARAVDSMPPWREAPRDRWVGLARELKDPARTILANHEVTAVRWGAVPAVEQNRTWGKIAPEAFRSGSGNWCAPGYLDGKNTTGKPYRWCELHELIPDTNHDRQRGGTTDEQLARIAKLEGWGITIDRSAWPDVEFQP